MKEEGGALGLLWGVVEKCEACQQGADCRSGGEGSSSPIGLLWGRCCRYTLCSTQLAPMGESCREANCVSI